MKSVLLFDIKSYVQYRFNYITLIGLLSFGIFAGNSFNFAVGEGIYLNSPYTIGFVLGLLSLSIIFIATVFSLQLLFKEWDAKFDTIVFSTPVRKRDFVLGRFTSSFLLTFFCFLLIVVGFIIGQNLRTGTEMQHGFHAFSYLYPLIIFGFINSLLVCSVLYFIAMKFRNKLMVAVSGLLLYVLYMVILVFSSSPFMAQSMPQSIEAQQLSAITDPFGLSAYFFESKVLSVLQRNMSVVPLSGYFLLNRVLTIAVAFILILLGYTAFSYSVRQNKTKKRDKWKTLNKNIETQDSSFFNVTTQFNNISSFRSVWSFVKTDLAYLFKSIAVAAATILLLFYAGMEMYAEIEKGIRLPQKYASSGLMAMTISESFHILGLLLMAYFVNDIYWRSNSAHFEIIENTTIYSKSKVAAHALSSTVLLLYFTALLILEGILFQLFYNYFHIDIQAYWGVLVFNTFPLLLFMGLLLLVNARFTNKYVALGISIVLAILFASPVVRKVLTLPLLRFYSGYSGVYSDFIGYGTYLPLFFKRFVFGFSVTGILWCIHLLIKNKSGKPVKYLIISILALTGLFIGSSFLHGYIPKTETEQNTRAAQYEKDFHNYQNLPQPTIKEVKTQIDLYPSRQAYTIKGTYQIKNLTDKPIEQILVNFPEGFEIQHASYISQYETIEVKNTVTGLHLQHALQPNETASFQFGLNYKWMAVNGYQSFNAIVKNGAFMRISRYYPQFGYQAGREISDENTRKQFALGKPAPIVKIDAPRTAVDDFILLDMTISTEENQTAIGNGELSKQWKEGNRNYFQYRTAVSIPFRFAISSANYLMKSETHNGIKIAVLYHPLHYENVEHLINNAKLTLNYCQQNFGPYPFHSVTFAEISSFTRGFAATAYPAVIFMAENMVFHANIKADEQQDVINELAGHELSHFWWGTNQIDPDDREGATMLTETLAMYTEMMMYKKLYGKEKMMERVEIQRQIYDSEKGFAENQPLYKVTGNNTHISYAKGAITMVKLSELIGEDKVNEALHNFLQKHKYPAEKPISTDLIEEIVKVSDLKYHAEIMEMFTTE